MKPRTLDGQLSLNFDTTPRNHERIDYPTPCPIREDCGAYLCETGGCSGERGTCTSAMLAAGIDIGAWRWRLMSGQERKAHLKALVGRCPHETKTVDVGGGKSFCALMDAWTNCREVKHCVHFADYGKG